jgi:hypothetical protein
MTSPYIYPDNYTTKPRTKKVFSKRLADKRVPDSHRLLAFKDVAEASFHLI